MVVTLPPGHQQLDHQPMDTLNINLDKPTAFEVWSLGLASVGIISLSGVTGAVLWPLLKSPLYKYVMAMLIGLAVGSLTSTALFQLLPEAFKLTVSTENYLNTATFGWLSIWIIFVIESVSKLAFHKTKDKASPKIKEMTKTGESAPLKDRIQNSSQENQTLTKTASEKIGAVAWIIIFGDGLHNFIDGMTIGAGYSQSVSTGIGLSIAIACEEFPHELGDFAILIQSGMSVTRALFYNFLSACTAFIGLVLGILLGQLEESHYIFAFAGGLFLYISLTHLIPELKSMLKDQLKKGKPYCLIYIILQNLGILLGATIIYFITRHNDFITGL
ncbi:metal cation symporter ZIP8-like isoform X2 [Rhodnius prolixus]